LKGFLHYKVSISFACCGQINNEGLESAAKSLRKLTSLQDLCLSLRECVLITPEGVEGLFKSFEGFKSMKKLSLDFRECELLEDQALARMSLALKDCVLLESLSLNFSWCRITEEGLKELFPVFRVLEKLKIVNLDFSYCKFFKEEVIQEMKKILNELPLLESENLSLAFHSDDEIEKMRNEII